MIKIKFLVQPFTTVASKVFDSRSESESLYDFLQTVKVGLYSTHTLKELANLAEAKLFTDFEDPQIKMIMAELASIERGNKLDIKFIQTPAYGPESDIHLLNGTCVHVPFKYAISLNEPYPSRFFAYCIKWLNNGWDDLSIPVVLQIEN